MKWEERCKDKKCWNRVNGHGIVGLAKPSKFKALSNYEHLCNTCVDFEICECDCHYPYCYKNPLIDSFKGKIMSISDVEKSKCDGGCDPSYCWNCSSSHSKRLYVSLDVVIHLLHYQQKGEGNNMKEFEEFNKWVKRIQIGCEEMREPPYEGIPTPLPRCNLTDDACRFDVCPKRQKSEEKTK
jgi:hypothetical protein